MRQLPNIDDARGATRDQVPLVLTKQDTCDYLTTRALTKQLASAIKEHHVSVSS